MGAGLGEQGWLIRWERGFKLSRKSFVIGEMRVVRRLRGFESR